MPDNIEILEEIKKRYSPEAALDMYSILYPEDTEAKDIILGERPENAYNIITNRMRTEYQKEEAYQKRVAEFEKHIEKYPIPRVARFVGKHTIEPLEKGLKKVGEKVRPAVGEALSGFAGATFTTIIDNIDKIPRREAVRRLMNFAKEGQIPPPSKLGEARVNKIKSLFPTSYDTFLGIKASEVYRGEDISLTSRQVKQKHPVFMFLPTATEEILKEAFIYPYVLYPERAPLEAAFDIAGGIIFGPVMKGLKPLLAQHKLTQIAVKDMTPSLRRFLYNAMPKAKGKVDLTPQLWNKFVNEQDDIPPEILGELRKLSPKQINRMNLELKNNPNAPNVINIVTPRIGKTRAELAPSPYPAIAKEMEGIKPVRPKGEVYGPPIPMGKKTLTKALEEEYPGLVPTKATREVAEGVIPSYEEELLQKHQALMQRIRSQEELETYYPTKAVGEAEPVRAREIPPSYEEGLIPKAEQAIGAREVEMPAKPVEEMPPIAKETAGLPIKQIETEINMEAPYQPEIWGKVLQSWGQRPDLLSQYPQIKTNTDAYKALRAIRSRSDFPEYGAIIPENVAREAQDAIDESLWNVGYKTKILGNIRTDIEQGTKSLISREPLEAKRTMQLPALKSAKVIGDNYLRLDIGDSAYSKQEMIENIKDTINGMYPDQKFSIESRGENTYFVQFTNKSGAYISPPKDIADRLMPMIEGAKETAGLPAMPEEIPVKALEEPPAITPIEEALPTKVVETTPITQPAKAEEIIPPTAEKPPMIKPPISLNELSSSIPNSSSTAGNLTINARHLTTRANAEKIRQGGFILRPDQLATDIGMSGKGVYVSQSPDDIMRSMVTPDADTFVDVMAVTKNPYVVRNQVENDELIQFLISKDERFIDTDFWFTNESSVARTNILKDAGYDSFIRMSDNPAQPGIREMVIFDPSNVRATSLGAPAPKLSYEGRVTQDPVEMPAPAKVKKPVKTGTVVRKAKTKDTISILPNKKQILKDVDEAIKKAPDEVGDITIESPSINQIEIDDIVMLKEDFQAGNPVLYTVTEKNGEQLTLKISKYDYKARVTRDKTIYTSSNQIHTTRKSADKNLPKYVEFKIDGGVKIFNTSKALKQFKEEVAKTSETMLLRTIPSKPSIGAKSSDAENIGNLLEGLPNGYFSDGSLLIKGTPPKNAKYQYTKEKTGQEFVNSQLIRKTNPADLKYYYIEETSGDQAVSKSPLPTRITGTKIEQTPILDKFGKVKEYIPETVVIPQKSNARVVFRVNNKYVVYDETKFNAIRNRYPEANYGIDRDGWLVAYQGDEPVGVLGSLKIGDKKIISSPPLADMAQEAGLLPPKIKKIAILDKPPTEVANEVIMDVSPESLALLLAERGTTKTDDELVDMIRSLNPKASGTIDEYVGKYGAKSFVDESQRILDLLPDDEVDLTIKEIIRGTFKSQGGFVRLKKQPRFDAMPDKDIERVFGEGTRDKTFLARLKEGIKNNVSPLRGLVWPEFEPELRKDMPQVAHSLLVEGNTIISRAKSAARKVAIGIYGNLQDSEKVQVMKLLVQRDALARAKLGKPVSGNFTVDRLERNLQAFEAYLQNHPSGQKILESADVARNVIRTVGENLVVRGKLNMEDLNPDYFHNLVMEYLPDYIDALPSRWKKVKSPFRAYTMQAEGHTSAIWTDPEALEYYFTRVFADNYKDDWFMKMIKTYDISDLDLVKGVELMPGVTVKALDGSTIQTKAWPMFGGKHHEYVGFQYKPGNSIYEVDVYELNAAKEAVRQAMEEAAVQTAGAISPADSLGILRSLQSFNDVEKYFLNNVLMPTRGGDLAYKTAQKTLLAIGRRHKVYAIPRPLYDKFARFSSTGPHEGILRLMQGTSLWKREVLNLWAGAGFGYQLLNFIGDGAAAFYLDAKSLLYVPRAAKAIWNRHNIASLDPLMARALKLCQEQDIFGAGFYREARALGIDLPLDISQGIPPAIAQLETRISKYKWYQKNPQWHKLSQRLNAFREGIIRLAIVADELDRIDKGRPLKHFYGNKLDALSDDEKIGYIGRKFAADMQDVGNGYKTYIRSILGPFATWSQKSAQNLYYMMRNKPVSTIAKTLGPISLAYAWNNLNERNQFIVENSGYYRRRLGTTALIGYDDDDEGHPKKAWIWSMLMQPDVIAEAVGADRLIEKSYLYSKGKITLKEAARDQVWDTLLAPFKYAHRLANPVEAIIEGIARNKKPFSNDTIWPKELGGIDKLPSKDVVRYVVPFIGEQLMTPVSTMLRRMGEADLSEFEELSGAIAPKLGLKPVVLPKSVRWYAKGPMNILSALGFHHVDLTKQQRWDERDMVFQNEAKLDKVKREIREAYIESDIPESQVGQFRDTKEFKTIYRDAGIELGVKFTNDDIDEMLLTKSVQIQWLQNQIGKERDAENRKRLKLRLEELEDLRSKEILDEVSPIIEQKVGEEVRRLNRMKPKPQGK